MWTYIVLYNRFSPDWFVRLFQVRFWTLIPIFPQVSVVFLWFVIFTCSGDERTHGVFQMGYIALRRALRSENNHGRHIEVSFQTEVLKISHFKGPFGLKDFEGYNWWTRRAPMILCADSLHDDGASVWWRRRALQETVVWSPTPFNPSKLSLRRVNALKGLALPNGMQGLFREEKSIYI